MTNNDSSSDFDNNNQENSQRDGKDKNSSKDPNMNNTTSGQGNDPSSGPASPSNSVINNSGDASVDQVLGAGKDVNSPVMLNNDASSDFDNDNSDTPDERILNSMNFS